MTPLEISTPWQWDLSDDQMTLRWLQMTLGWLLRWLQMTLRWLQMTLRWLRMTLRWLLMTSDDLQWLLMTSDDWDDFRWLWDDFRWVYVNLDDFKMTNMTLGQIIQNCYITVRLMTNSNK